MIVIVPSGDQPVAVQVRSSDGRQLEPTILHERGLTIVVIPSSDEALFIDVLGTDAVGVPIDPAARVAVIAP